MPPLPSSPARSGGTQPLPARPSRALGVYWLPSSSGADSWHSWSESAIIRSRMARVASTGEHADPDRVAGDERQPERVLGGEPPGERGRARTRSAADEDQAGPTFHEDKLPLPPSTPIRATSKLDPSIGNRRFPAPRPPSCHPPHMLARMQAMPSWTGVRYGRRPQDDPISAERSSPIRHVDQCAPPTLRF